MNEFTIQQIIIKYLNLQYGRQLNTRDIESGLRIWATLSFGIQHNAGSYVRIFKKMQSLDLFKQHGLKLNIIQRRPNFIFTVSKLEKK